MHRRSPCSPARALRAAVILALLAALAAPARGGVGDVHPTSLPEGLVARSDSLVIRWAEPSSCQLELGPAPDALVPLAGASGGPGRLAFVPEALALGAGAWAARLVNANGVDSSLPFVLFVEADAAPNMIAPQNGSEIPAGGAMLRWEPVLGVPYYHVLFSDQEIVIEEDAEGNPVIAGAAIVWQAITPGTAIAYGDIDPSGVFTAMNGTAPPLVAGAEYNWIVLNNYAGNPALSSTRQAGVAAFTVAAMDLPAPVLLAPADGDSLAAPSLAFHWSEVPEASHYQFTLSRLVDEDGNEGAVGVYDQVTSQPLLDLPAGSLLVQSRYRWKVYALDEAGQGAVSAPGEFSYAIAMGLLRVFTRNQADQVLPYVPLTLTPLGGGGSALPAITGGSGVWDDELVPGSYLVAAALDGHEPASAEASVLADASTELTLVLAESPATLAGSVRDPQEQPLAFALVSARNVQTGALRELTATAGGAFALGVGAGSWRLSAACGGYHAADSLLVSVAAGAYLSLPSALHLAPNACTLSGSVRTTSGQPLLAATVTASKAGQSLQYLTGADGQFQFSVDSGTWTLGATKSGYVPPAPRSVTLAPGTQLAIDPPLALSAQAAILSGFVEAAGGLVGGALVTATPTTGFPHYATAGSQGSWQLSLPAGTWTLQASKSGYSAGAALQLTLAPGGGQSGLALTLSPNPCRVAGLITDGSAPLAGATLSAGALATTSAWDGSYSLALAAGTHSLQAFKTGYSGAAQEITLAPGQELTGLDFTLAPGAATVSGRVLAQGLPVAAALVRLAGAMLTVERTSAADGAFTLSAPPGGYTLSAEKNTMLAGPPLALTLAAGQTLPDQELQLTPAGARLSGRVLAEGSALRDAQVQAVSALGSSATGSAADGSWSLLLAGGADWTLSAGKSGYATIALQTPLLADGAVWSHDFTLTPQAAQLTGTVREDGGLAVAGAVLLLSRADGGSLSATSDGSGRYGVATAPGAITLSLDESGYAPYSTALALAEGATTYDIQLDARFASLTGTLQDGGGAPLAGVSLQVTGSASASTLSDADGNFALPRLVAGSSTLRATKGGYASLSQPLVLADDESAELALTLERLLGGLDGRVQDDAGAALAGVGLQLWAGGTLRAQATSGASGTFSVGALDPEQTLELYASLPGHSSLSPNPQTGLLPGGEPVLVTLARDDGSLRGRVLSAADGNPLAGAQVSAADGLGSYAETTSDAAGSFLLTGLPRVALYTLRADAPGFTPAALAGLAPTGEPQALELQPAPANIYGSLLNPRAPGAPLPAGASLRALPLAGGGGSGVALPLDAPGAYSLTGLPPGDFTLICRVDGYVTEPREQLVSLAEGQAAGPYDFELTPVALASLSISGLDALDNDQSAIFRGTQQSAAGELLDYPLSWSLEPATAGSYDAASGRFLPRPEFLGPVVLRARHVASGLSAERTLAVTARLAPGSARALDDGRGLLLSLPAGAALQPLRIGLSRQAVNPLKRRAGSFRVEGELYRFLPDGLQFAEAAPPTLTLPVPNGLFNRGLALGWWDPAALDWERLPASKGAAGLSREIAHFSDYALLVANAPLGVAHAALSANPFSPVQAPLELRFSVSSQSMAAPLVEVELFNLLGDPIRRLLRRQALAAGEEHSLSWDGRTEAGELARNGRYLLRIRIEDAEGEAERILPVVLVK